MRIVQIITRAEIFYGAQCHVLDLSTLQHNAGHHVEVLVGNEGEMTERLRANGVTVRILDRLQRNIRPWRDYHAISDIQEVLREIRPDVVATHSSKAGVVGRLAAQRENIANVFTAHGWSFEENIPLVRREIFASVEKWVGKDTDHFIAVADLGRELGLKRAVASDDRITTIHYGVSDLSETHSRQPSDVFTMTMVAGFREQKDHPTLLRALSQLKDREWKLNFLGHGELFESVRQLASELGIADKVNFAGAVTNVTDYLAQTDVKVLITHWEGLPISVIEALSLGIPVIASDVSGVSEEVIDGHNGLLTERKNADSVRDAILKLLDDHQLRERFGRNSRQLYEEQFSPELMLEKTLDVYRRAYARRHGQAIDDREAEASYANASASR